MVSIKGQLHHPELLIPAVPNAAIVAGDAVTGKEFLHEARVFDFILSMSCSS
jgi:hypothetical protein